MSLPKRENAESKRIVLFSGKEVNIRPWRVKEEKELLFSTDGIKDKQLIKKEIDKLIAKCVDNVDLASLTETEKLQLCIELRKLSKGEQVEFAYVCSACKCRNEGIVDLNTNIVSKAFVKSESVYKNGNVYKIIEVSDLVMRDLKDNFPKVSEFNHNLLVNSIESLIIDGTPYTNFTLEDMGEYIDTLDIDEYDFLMEEIFKKVSVFVVSKETTCISCGKKSIISFEEVPDFFGF